MVEDNVREFDNGIYAAPEPAAFPFTMALKLKQMVTTRSHILHGTNNENSQSLVNYHFEDLVKALDKYSAFNLENPFILVDTNHDNSGKTSWEQVRIVHLKSFLNHGWDERIADTVRGFYD